jgi:hypothetical protein
MFTRTRILLMSTAAMALTAAIVLAIILRPENDKRGTQYPNVWPFVEQGEPTDRSEWGYMTYPVPAQASGIHFSEMVGYCNASVDPTCEEYSLFVQYQSAKMRVNGVTGRAALIENADPKVRRAFKRFLQAIDAKPPWIIDLNLD